MIVPKKEKGLGLLLHHLPCETVPNSTPDLLILYIMHNSKLYSLNTTFIKINRKPHEFLHEV